MPVEVLRDHFQIVHRQFAADDDRRPADADPALVDLTVVEQAAGALQRRLFVIARVEEADDFAVDADGPRNPDDLPEGPRHPLGDARLAVAGGAVQEQAAAGVDRRAEPAEHPRVDQQIVEGALQIVGRRMLVGERLAATLAI